MNRFEFLSSLKEQGDIKQIRDTWAALGSLEVDSNTKVYIKDTICKITSDNKPIVTEKPATVTGNFLTQLQNMLQLPGSKLTLKQEDLKEDSGIENSTWILENDKGVKKLTIKTKIVGHFWMKTVLNIHFQEGEMIVYDNKDATKIKRYSVHKSINHYIAFASPFEEDCQFPLMDFRTIQQEIGFKVHKLAIWPDRSMKKLTAWGSWLSASAPNIQTPYEGILISYKNQWKKIDKGESTIGRDLFIEGVSGIWNLGTTKGLTKANFPERLPEMCIELLTYKGDTVLDPFMGSGTTAKVAQNTDRNFIGFEISPNYFEIANDRLVEGKNNLWK
jgi:hypothetical protein